MKVKICGLTSGADAAAAAGLGAWALGVVLAAESPRRVTVEQAVEIFKAVPAGLEPLKIGVFVNAGLKRIAAAVEECGLNAVQLHGDERPEFCSIVRERLHVAVIKAVRVSGPGSLSAVAQFDSDYILLDTYHPEKPGGTGETFDWQLARRFFSQSVGRKFIVSGGLKPENVAAAVATLRPFAVDVSSGVESGPGRKDHEKLTRLFRALAESEPEVESESQ